MIRSLLLSWNILAAISFISLFNGSASYPSAVGNYKSYLMPTAGDLIDRWSDNRNSNFIDPTNDPYIEYENNDLILTDPLSKYLETNMKKWCQDQQQNLDEPTRENIRKIFSNENFKRTIAHYSNSNTRRGSRNTYIINHGKTTETKPKADKKHDNVSYNDHFESLLNNKDVNDDLLRATLELLGKE